MAQNIIFLGAPGAGKGTQAVSLSESISLPHLATGDLLRSAVANKTPIGLQAKKYMERGDLVPDEIVVGVLQERLDVVEKEGVKGFILDGFPRTESQAKTLETMLRDREKEIDVVIFIDVSENNIMKRLCGRRSCPKPGCGRVYNLTFNPPKIEGRCDGCETELVQRKDDEAGTIRARLAKFKKDTAPLISFYENKGVLKRVEGSGSVDDVCQAIEASVSAS